jgi:hypothetical protein
MTPESPADGCPSEWLFEASPVRLSELSLKCIVPSTTVLYSLYHPPYYRQRGLFSHFFLSDSYLRMAAVMAWRQKPGDEASQRQ